ncbi:uncharacterized protein N7496_006349 [Penicillium cataractarum]|uniref:Protein kinase domain-containing protein n=1 Tax=Penicillium cataractarum TaxID=2100454 RepID=A0A9W9V685_9EURO|nr:uncharacterized protein N7496_006349 [Penicillium cataractarum]KAJ5370257.1 hypothetical protein N7496_006349 [Penicillium cataractarum]
MATTNSQKPFYELRNKLHLQFLLKFERRKDDQHRFAPIGTSREVLQPDVLRSLFGSLDWSPPIESDLSEDDFTERIDEQGLHDFLAILLFSSCAVKDVHTFTTELLVTDIFRSSIFTLPTTNGKLKLLFEEKVTRDKFLANQAIFCPVVIHQGKEQRVEDPGRRRLPYLEEKWLAQGGYGTVYKVKVATRHFYDDRNGTANPAPLEVARKDYVISSQFPAASKEHAVLEKILASDRSCENIVENFGSLAIGPDKYSLFMPLAICDLKAYMMDYHDIKPSTTKEKAAIILSAWGLARGLNFLHHEMKTPQGDDLVCYHMDLKPSNILIFQGDDDRKIWKISDFGMARVKLKKKGENIEKERDFNSWFVKRSKPGPEPTPTPTLALHGEGTYLAPESMASISSMKTGSDVWSLGCVISVLFVYLEMGAEGVTRYSEARSNHAKADGVDRFFLRDKGFGPFKSHPVVKNWHERLILSGKQRSSEEGKALKDVLHFLEKDVFRDQSRRCGVGKVGNILQETYNIYSNLEDVDSSRHDQDPTIKQRILGRFLKRRAIPEDGGHIRRWTLKTAHPFKNCEISSDGSLVVFWTDTELTLFTSLSVSSGDGEAHPQAEWSLENEDSNWFWKNVRLTNRFLLASTSGGTFRCYVFDLKRGTSVDASFSHLKCYTPSLPEIVDLAISSDSKLMACILHGREEAPHRALLYIAPVAAPGEYTQMEELNWPATDIVELSFPTNKDIYLIIRPRINIHSQEEKATLVHICLTSKRLESVIFSSQGFGGGADVGLFTTFAPTYLHPSICAVVTKERRLYIQGLEEANHAAAMQADIKSYRILKLMTGWDKGKMFAIGRHVASHNMILLEVQLPTSGTSGVSIRELAQFTGLSYNDQFTERLGYIQGEKYVLLAALMSANQRAIYKVQID